LRRHLKRLAAEPLTRGQKVALETAEWLLAASPRGTAQDLRRATELVTELALSRPSGPALPINRPISANRSYAMTRAPLDRIKAAGKAAGGTINDAILAAISGMLAGYLREAGVVPAELERDPVALVPVSVRREDDDALGNRISVVFVDLPVGEPDPRRRIALLNERMTAIKGSAKVAAGALAVDMTGFAPPLLASIMARAGGGSFNLVVSNVPGPQIPLYMSGSRVLAIHPAVPLNPADQGLAVGVFSYDGSACFGLSADRDLDPPVERAAAALDEALAELLAAA
jgi:WS/DGAT/MGAT family acyltransferase